MDTGFEQMTYNFQNPQNAVNMATRSSTRYTLRPTPVILQRVPAASGVPYPLHMGVGIQGMMPFEQRMDLASRLAQRELERRSQSLKEDGIQYKDKTHDGGQQGRHDFKGVEPHEKPPTRKPARQGTKEKHQSRDPKPAPSHSHVTFNQNTKDKEVSNRKEKDKMADVAGCDASIEFEIEQTSQEILKLRKDLTRRMQRLKLVSLKADLESSPPSLSPVKPHPSDEGRLGWIEDKSDRRRQQKTHGQAVRNARLIYQLQQKIREAQRDMKAPNSNAKTRLLAMHRLASAHRTAVRTLHHLTSVGVPVGGVKGYSDRQVSSHDELASMVKQLSMLCVEARIGENESEEEQMTSLLKELNDYHSHVKHLLQSKTEAASNFNSPAKKFVSPQIQLVTGARRKPQPPRKGKGRQNRQRGVLLDPKLTRKRFISGRNERETAKLHFTRQTVASANKNGSNMRKKILAKHPPSRPTLSSLEVPHPLPDSTPTSTIVPSHRPPVSLSSVNPPNNPVTDSHRLPPTSTQNPSEGMVWLPWERASQSIEEREIARRALELEESQRKDTQEPTNDSSNGSELSEANFINKKSDERDQESKMSKSMEVEETHKSSAASGSEVLGLMDRIQEMERERNALQLKWQSIHYDFDIHTNKGTSPQDIIRPSKEGLIEGPQAAQLHSITYGRSVGFKTPVCTLVDDLDSTGTDISIGTRPSNDNTRPEEISTRPSDINTRLSDVNTRPSDVNTRPSNVNTRPSNVNTRPSATPIHYGLPVTDYRINRVPNYKQLQIERIADNLLDSLIQNTVSEVQDLIHSCIEQLYDNEFHTDSY